MEKTLSIEEQLSKHILAPMETIVFFISQTIFRNTRGFENWEMSLGYSSALAEKYSIT